jgi:hypothetical protein
MWHTRDLPATPINVRCWGHTGKHILSLSFSDFDPTRTSANISCCSSEAQFDPLSKCAFEPLLCGLLSQGANMKRREFLGVLGGAAASWPLAVRAQQQATSTIGFVSSRAPGESAGVGAAFRRGLGEAGFVEGQNLAIAFRWAEGRYDRLPALAAELVNLRVAVLFAAGGTPSALAAKEATSTIPVVFSAVNDPVRLGLVPSLNRPGGNVTGMSLLNSELVAKSAQFFKEAVPAAAVIVSRKPFRPKRRDLREGSACDGAGAGDPGSCAQRQHRARFG